ncbi:ABC transporter ATP-binding protein [Solibacillus daqui]|uniref:ABC transporter ATP-binding protein n=1 Tax=Solibacillus daqui TaxID=2912187 RepID=UPI0023656C2F|nr:ABC transporter ATP-binding protein [Solibacillus daqui]
MLKIFSYLQRKEWILVSISIVFIVVQVFLDLKLPDYMAEITMLIQTDGTSVNDLIAPGSYMLLCAIGSMIAAVIVGYFAAQVAAGLARRLRGQVFEKTLSFSMAEMNHFSTASLITRSTNDITQVQMLVAMGLQVVIKAPILAIWAITKIANKNLEWTAATGVAVLVLILLISIIVIFAIPKFRIIQTLTDNLNRVTRENLTGIRVVRAYNAEGYQLEKFDGANKELMDTNLYAMRLMALIFPTMGLIMSGLSLSIYWIGAFLIHEANAAEKLPLFSDMVVFMSYAMQVVMAFMMVSMIFIMMPRAVVSAKRILEVLNTKITIQDGNGAVGSGVGTVEFRGVSFKYPGAEEAIVEDVSFSAKKGETVAFIGATGSGKTTILNLIPRLYDVSSGAVFVDGINVKDYKQEALHKKIGYVSQSAVLFSGSVASNVSYGAEATMLERVKEAVTIAQGQDFVEKLDGSYEATISQGGKNISGGQKQRLSIARAIYHQPDIYLFDDSFSALDYKTDRALRQALKTETKDAITFIVAQRIGTIKEANQIIVLEHGRIVGKGTHEELMKTCETYKEIAYSQLSKEELGDGK